MTIIKRTYKVKLPNGKIVVRKCEHWTIQYRNAAGKIKRKKGYKDKRATEQLAARLQLAMDRGEEDLIDEFKVQKATPLDEHLAAYLADLEAAGRDDKYIENMGHRIKSLLAECNWTQTAHIEPNAFLRWRQSYKQGQRKGKSHPAQGASATTLNQYLDSARAFCNWMRKTKRIASNPLAEVDKVEGSKRRLRRALTDEQVTALLAAAPADRKLVYRLALSVGLRRSELEALQWGDLHLAAIRPFIRLRAEATKARRGDLLPLQQTLAHDLRTGRPDDAKDTDAVFPIVPGLNLWKEDLKTAKIPYADEMGRVADFHGGTRKTLCSRMHRQGIPLAVAMRIMRHTDARLTMVDYADDEQLGTEEAIDAMPELLPEAKPQAPLAVANA